MDFYYTEKRPVSAETWPKTSCSYSLRSHKVNPLKKKRVHFLLEEIESQLSGWPNNKKRTNSILKGPVSAETWPKTSCSYSLRSHKVKLDERPNKRRRTNSILTGPVSAETWPKTSCSYSLRSHKVNPLKKKRVHFLLEDTESQLNKRPNKRRRTNSILKVPPSAETWSETSCSYSLKSHKVNPLKKKSVDRPKKKMPQKQKNTEREQNNLQKVKEHEKGQNLETRWLEMKELLSTYSEPPTSHSSDEDDLGDLPDPRSDKLPDDFSNRYTIGELLGKGSYAKVYTGVRKTDGGQVAIKYLLKGYVDYFTLPGDTHSLPHEGVLMELVSKPRCSPFVIKQLEWFETAAGFLLIMEQPHNFITLGKFRKGLKGRMSEDVARIIMRKIIRALIHCRDNGVIHGDIKEANILLNPETLDLKLIDFGRARLIYRRFYKFGVFPIPLPSLWVSEFYPWELSSTVRGLGSLLYTLTCGKNIPNNPLPLYIGGLSKACSMLIHGCLHKDNEKLPFYELILWDKWSQVKTQADDHLPKMEKKGVIRRWSRIPAVNDKKHINTEEDLTA
ncbi:serine/threonine-protein kinase DCLK3-like isoform X2 [Tachysurus fulvidraco]|uniref:serine/threonine-protein kinase DCLK3-like isoform X2 n=1 Tax=Tachysurus fulvidraco TaxID=1234273 RepID=UPI001FEF48EF|nr:serine/threonine-protein kinase DCLK3-like isoform X2 [Tachysurus fulvidraco]